MISPGRASPLSIRPKPGLARTGLLGATLVTVALFGSLYLVSVPDGPWIWVLAFHSLGMCVAAYWLVRYWTTKGTVAGEQITLRSFPFPTKRIATTAVARFLVAEVYVGGTSDTHVHLAALDTAGRQLFRLRTRYWARKDMTEFATAIGSPITVLPQPLTARDFTAKFIHP